MIQVIKRALTVLELLASSGEEGRPLGEIAGKVGLNKATCAHILKTLVELKVAEQVAPRKGYRLGPLTYTMARSDWGYRRDLVRAAEPFVEKLAREVRETVLLAVLRGDQRFTLCQVDGTQDVQVRNIPSVVSNIYELATGRLLLAYSRPGAVAAVVGVQGLPGKRWGGIEREEQLQAALDAIGREGRVIHVTPEHVVGIAYPVRQGDRVEAALGLYLPEYRFTGEHREVILAGLERTAREISAVLTWPTDEAADSQDQTEVEAAASPVDEGRSPMAASQGEPRAAPAARTKAVPAYPTVPLVKPGDWPTHGPTRLEITELERIAEDVLARYAPTKKKPQGKPKGR